MRALIILAVILAVMFFAGWLVVSNSGDSASLEIRTDKIKEDTAEVVENTKEVFSEAGERIEDAVAKP